MTMFNERIFGTRDPFIGAGAGSTAGGAWGDIPPSPPGFPMEPPIGGARGGMFSIPTEMPVQPPYIMPTPWEIPNINPLIEDFNLGANPMGYWPRPDPLTGEMIQERMADRQAGPLMPVANPSTTTGSMVNLGNQLGTNDYLYNPGANQYIGSLPWASPELTSSLINFPSAASTADIQDITRRAGPPYNPISDFARTTTMGTGWEFPTVSEPPNTWNLRRDPILGPMIETPWDSPLKGWNEKGGWGMKYGLPALAGLATMGMSLPFYNPWDYNPFQNTPWSR